MIISVQSLSRNLDYLQAVIQKKVLIIVDEAHHTLAPSYRIIIKKIRQLATTVKLLGLTATPVRMHDRDTAMLMQLFDNHIIYNISMSELITKGILSKPFYTQIDTHVDFETRITLDEREYIRKWGELSPETQSLMASMKERNTLIAETFLSKRKEFGKTLIFAINGAHCISLCEELQKHGVKCDYIYCAHQGNEEKIAAFKKGELEVLVNINILTEGSDVPDIQTVFLTRPTQSDVLLMQMIGRGMRGPDCGGTKTVNIIDFHDVWGNMVNWLNPKFVLADEKEESYLPHKGSTSNTQANMVPWEMLQDLLEGIKTRVPLELDGGHATLPIGWYDVVDEDGNDSKVMVFDSQMPGYLAMWRDRSRHKNAEFVDSQGLLREYFSGFGLPPACSDLQLLLDTYRMEGEMPHLHRFTERDKVDAYLVAQELLANNVRINNIQLDIENRYAQNTEIINSVYGNIEAYRQRVFDFLLYPTGSKPQGCRIEEFPESSMTLDRCPLYDLQELMKEVVNEMFEGNYGKTPEITWTNKPYKSYFGLYRYPEEGTSQRPQILINQLLNSKDVPRETVKYLIYHELLHRDYPNHSPAFRAQEHLYPDWTTHERFLDATFPMFDLMYAM